MPRLKMTMHARTPRRLFAAVCLAFAVAWFAAQRAKSAAPPEAADAIDVACIGLHGGVYEQLAAHASELGLNTAYFDDRGLMAGQFDLAKCRLILVEHLRADERDAIRALFVDAKRANPNLRIVALGPATAQSLFADLGAANPIERDREMESYYGSTPENLRRMTIYIAARALGHSHEVLPPETAIAGGLYHPDRDGRFESAAEFLKWNRGRGQDRESRPRVAVAVHETHLAFQQPAVVDALIAALEKRGLTALAVVDMRPEYEATMLELQPDVVVHTCHSRDSAAFREQLGAPHLHSLFFRAQSIDEWQVNTAAGLAPSEQAFQMTSQELLGAIEPLVGAGTMKGGGSDEAFSPIPERIEHLADRAAAWVRLRTIDHREKKIAIVYYDREMGKGELMRGSATGMFLNAPRSLVRLLAKMQGEGYAINPVPETEDQLLDWLQERGRLVGPWAPETLDRLARSGQAALIPVAQYQEWFESRVPEAQRREVIEKWGPPPGKFASWSDGKQSYIVVPRIDLGGVVLLPQPLRGEAQDSSLLHDKRVPPPHNYLATYFWLQESFAADALIHFGTHGSEFLLPGKASGLGPSDWPDVVLGRLPNINPWIVNNLGESTPVRRRAYAVPIGHLTPLSTTAGLSDELKNLHDDIHKWEALDEGALKESFRDSITRQVADSRLADDLKLEVIAESSLTDAQIDRVADYLHEIESETTPTSLHVLGEIPSDELLLPYLVLCLRSPFLEALAECIGSQDGMADDVHRATRLRELAAEALRLVLRQGMSLANALQAIGAAAPAGELPPPLQAGFDLARKLDDGFQRTPQELDNLVGALAGRFISPGPGNSPDRNPSVLPTGRSLYVLNPEELPSRPSWEVGVQLIDRLLADRREQTGQFPRRVAFTLTPFSAYADYGVMEAQILYLLGMRPIWDGQNAVVDVEAIPAAQLGRPRIDVFIAASGYYRDLMPSRMRLIDKAVGLAASLEEPDNFVREHALAAEKELVANGMEAAKAKSLSRVRQFGPPPGESGSASYYYLVERSGEWNSREELAQTYALHNRFAYGQGQWGVESAESYKQQMQGAEIVLRNWSDRTRSPLSNKYDWYQGGSLSLAIRYATGKEPDFILSDLRDADRPTLVGAEDALAREFHVRLFNRKWIEGMMREGYAGADQVAVHVSNTLGWKTMRPESVSDATWNEIVNVYVRDSRHLRLNEWFEAENPFAFQDLTEILLEAARKEYWRPDEATLREVALAYARSTLRHGPGEGLRGGDNAQLDRFVQATLDRAQAPADLSLAESYRNRNAPAAPAKSTTSGENAAQSSNWQPVEGRELAPPTNADSAAQPESESSRWDFAGWGLALAAILLVAAGYGIRGAGSYR